ncbi:MAG: autotransporter-associated beta strand repeat-containing protein, partial [Acidimicrobiales bacterium]|nr:autotransporter-associated beta strand repeat-containing protein [Acidimicrobiales bacterium]
MRKGYRNPFLRSALAASAAVLSSAALHAEDLAFSGTGTVRLLAQDWAAYMPSTSTFNGEINDGGRLFWRGSAGDGQYIHFDLTRLSGLTVSSDASVTLQGARTQWGDSVTDSFIATANGSWTAAGGAAIPGATAIGDATNATGSYAENAPVSWGIGSSTFQGYVDNASSFNGLAIIGGAGSTMHFWAPLNPYLEVTTNADMTNVVTVTGGASWNAGNYSFTNGVLSINDGVAGGTSGAGAVTINSLGTVFVNGNSGDNRYWAIDSTTINSGGVLVMQGHSHIHNLTLNGGELAGIRPNGSWGSWSFDDATVVTGNATSTISAQEVNFDNGNFTVDSGSTLNITGSIRSGQIIKAGEGSMVLSGSNASSGGITIDGGTLVAAKSAQDNGIHTLGSGNLTINNGGTLRSAVNWATSSEWNGTSVGTITINQGGSWEIEALGQTVRNGLFLNGGSVSGTLSNADWGALHLKSDVTAGGNAVSSIAVDTALSGSKTITVESGSQLNYSGVIHNQIGTNSGITKAGGGTLVLSAANSYTGGTSVNGGSLQISGSGTIGIGALSVGNGASLDLGGSTQVLGGQLNSGGAGNGAVGTIANGTLDLNGQSAFLQSGTFTMNLTGGGNSRLWIGGDGAATVELGGNNTSTFSDSNSTIIGHETTGAAGTVKLLSATALGPNGQNTQVHSGTLDLNGQTNVTVSTILLNNGNLANSNTGAAASYSGVVTFNGTTPQIGGDGDIMLSGELTSGGFTKTGSGTLTLAGTSSYTGATTVSLGSLVVNGNISTSVLTTVEDGASLSG